MGSDVTVRPVDRMSTSTPEQVLEAIVDGINTGPTGDPVRLEERNADVLRRQADGTWRFLIDNPWGVD